MEGSWKEGRAAGATAPAASAAAPAAPAATAGAGEQSVDAPMLGKIIEIKVLVGQVVKVRESLVILG